MTTANGAHEAILPADDPMTDDVAAWLQQVFVAARTPAPCRLPAPRITERAGPVARSQARPAVRASFVAMLALSASALLLAQ
jgi:hypothetical protein